MLILTRRVGQAIIIKLKTHVDPSTPIGDLLNGGHIEIRLQHVAAARVKFSVAANDHWLILREELLR